MARHVPPDDVGRYVPNVYREMGANGSQKPGFLRNLKNATDAAHNKVRLAALERDREKIRDVLATMEDDNPVDILTFVKDSRYLNLGEFIYPAGQWILKSFYEPWNCWENVEIEWKGKPYVFPGYKSQGFTKEECQGLYFNKLVGVIGQRFGKSVLSAICVLYETYKLLCLRDPTTAAEGIAPGTLIQISVGATSQRQSQGTVWAYVTEFRDNSPWFQRYIDACRQLKMGGEEVYSERDIDFHFKHKNIQVNAVHSKSSGLRGATRACVVMDEIAHFDDGAKNNADNVYAALINSLKTFKQYGRAIIISSPLHIADKACRLFAECGTQFEWAGYEEMGWEPLKEFNGRPIQTDDHMVGYHFPTWEVNPHLSREDFDGEFAANPESAWRDFGAMPSQALEAYFRNPAKIDEIFDGRPCPIDERGQINTKILKPKPGIRSYHLHADVGAGKPSNFGICLAHAEPQLDPKTREVVHKTIIDLAYAVEADADGEMDFEGAREILNYIIDAFPNVTYSSDKWNDLEYRQRIKKKGVKVLDVVLSIVEYDELKNQIYLGKIRCHDYPKVGNELKRLELVNGKRIEKGEGYTKDVADCLAAVVARVTEKYVKRATIGRVTLGTQTR